MKPARVEPVLVAFFLATWIVNSLERVGLIELAGNFDLALYPLYGLAGGMGWAAGLVYVSRSRGLDAQLRWRVWLIYFMGPPGLLFLIRAMAPIEVQRAAPLVALYAFGVFSVFFLVQVRLMPHPHPRRPVDGDDSDDDRSA